MPRLCSTAVCALRILLAATIFMAFVILPMFLIALMRCLTAGGRDTQMSLHISSSSNSGMLRVRSKPKPPAAVLELRTTHPETLKQLRRAKDVTFAACCGCWC